MNVTVSVMTLLWLLGLAFAAGLLLPISMIVYLVWNVDIKR